MQSLLHELWDISFEEMKAKPDFCVMTHSLPLQFGDSRSAVRCVLAEFLPLFQGITCARQPANQTWQLFTLTGWDERFWVYHSGLRSPKRMGKKTDKAGKRACKFLYSGLSRMLCFWQAGRRARRLTRAACLCVRAQSYSRNTDTLLLIPQRRSLMFKVLYLLCMPVLSNHFQHRE